MDNLSCRRFHLPAGSARGPDSAENPALFSDRKEICPTRGHLTLAVPTVPLNRVRVKSQMPFRRPVSLSNGLESPRVGQTTPESLDERREP